jgi:hypothetical protein
MAPYLARFSVVVLRTTFGDAYVKDHDLAVARKDENLLQDQCDFTRPVLSRKIFRFACRANHLYKLAPSRALQEGRFAIVTDVERGMRWTRAAPLTNGADADGEVVWS